MKKFFRIISIFTILFIGIFFVFFTDSIRVKLTNVVGNDESEMNNSYTQVTGIDTNPGNTEKIEDTEKVDESKNTDAGDVLRNQEVILDAKSNIGVDEVLEQQIPFSSQLSLDLSDSEMKACYNFVFSDPPYKVPACLSPKDKECIEYYTNSGFGDMENENYKKLNKHYFQELNKLYEKIKPIESADKVLDEYQYAAFFKKNSKDAFAKELLTSNSYVIEKVTNFQRFDQFVIIFHALFGEVVNDIARKEERVANFVPPTKKQEEEAIAYLEKSATIIEPDKSHPGVVVPSGDSSYIGSIDIDTDDSHPSLTALPDEVHYSYTIVDGKIKASLIYPSSDVDWRIFPITEYRIAGNTWDQREVDFDIVLEDGKWKFDIWEPQRPGKENNPRILLFGLEEDYLETNWKVLKETVRQQCI
jgi:hypothetical protein